MYLGVIKNIISHTLVFLGVLLSAPLTTTSLACDGKAKSIFAPPSAHLISLSARPAPESFLKKINPKNVARGDLIIVFKTNKHGGRLIEVDSVYDGKGDYYRYNFTNFIGNRVSLYIKDIKKSGSVLKVDPEAPPEVLDFIRIRFFAWGGPSSLRRAWGRALIKAYYLGMDLKRLTPAPHKKETSKRGFYTKMKAVSPELTFGSTRNRISLVRRKGGRGGSIVYEFTVEGETYFVRPLIPGNVEPVRKTLAEAKLDELIGSDSFPETFWGKVTGVTDKGKKVSFLGAISRAAQGKVGTADIKRLQTTQKSYVTNAMGLSFMAGDFDASQHNVAHRVGRKIELFDAGHAFVLGVSRGFQLLDHRYDLWEDFLGTRPPDSYTPEFEAGLRSTSARKLKTALGFYLTGRELEGVTIRRFVLISDMDGMKEEN